MPVDKDDELKEDRGDEFIPPGMETEDPEDEDVEDIDPEEEEDEESDSDEDEDEDEDDEDSDEDEEDSDDDEDDESDDEDDEEDEDEGDAAEEQRIPKGRLNQVLKQRDEEREHRKWLEQQLETLIRAQTKAEEKVQEEEEVGPPEYDFDEAETQYVTLLLEGESEKAAKLRGAINDARDELYQYQIDAARKSIKSEAVRETTSSLDEVRFTALVGEYTEQFDFLNDQSDSYNEKAVTMANKLMASYVAEGKSKSEALTAAVGDIVPLFAKPEAPKKNTSDVRKKAARKKAAKASRQQPPATKSARGKAERKFSAQDVMNMSEKEFNSLTAREKAKLRGDIA